MRSGKKIVFTGGGSAGHVTANMALIPRLKEAGWKIEYIGSETGIERQLIESRLGVPYHPISTGKLRRYLDWNNMKDPFKVIKGVFQAYRLLKRIKPDLVFSKGGFVSVPVILGSRMNRIPVIIHESDLTPGLANKISIPFARKVCVTFPETVDHIPGSKAVHTGTPIRPEILSGNPESGFRYCEFQQGKPVLLIMGGSQGSKSINQAIWKELDLLLTRFQIVHICGKGNVNERLADLKHYRQFEYIHEELPDVLAMTDIVVSRAGSNSIYEFLALKIPMLLIPLSLQASRGDQIVNAESFRKSGYCSVLQEKELAERVLFKAIDDVYRSKDEIISCMQRSSVQDSISQIVRLIHETAGL